MEWTNPHDIALCREIILVNPFKAKKKTIPRAKLWEEVATNVNKMDTIEFNTSQRGVRDRYTRISKKFRARMVEEQRASGISPETSKLDVLLEELIKLEDSCYEEVEKNAKKAEQEKEKAVDLHMKVMERISETQKRKKDGDKQVKTKNRKSGKETIPYLVEKGNRDAELKKQELEIRKAEVEAEKNRHDEMAQSENIIMSLLCLSRTE